MVLTYTLKTANSSYVKAATKEKNQGTNTLQNYI